MKPWRRRSQQTRKAHSGAFDTGVYVPTTEEMDAADALGGAFRGVEDGYGKVTSIATARRIAEALATYDAARKNVTIP